MLLQVVLELVALANSTLNSGQWRFCANLSNISKIHYCVKPVIFFVARGRSNTLLAGHPRMRISISLTESTPVQKHRAAQNIKHQSN